MARLLLLLAIGFGVFLLLRWLSRQPGKVQWQVLAGLAAAGLLVLVLTGRAHWLAAVIAAILPFLQFLFRLLLNIPFPLLRRLLGGLGVGRPQSQPSGGQTSTVESRYLRMTLNHDSGDIDGEVLAGQFAGKSLNQLELDALLQLLNECQDDEESVALLQAYLDRVHGDRWQQQAGEQARRQTAGPSAEMSRDEALQVLGLSDAASEDEIVEAHRRLMQKLHPDRGGSSYLAAVINQAKDTLLGK